ncbi:hypothetical protein ACFQ4Q_01905 [Lysobacter gummosus]|uniref:hypothetical protein n=1 Tax=Lysobacter gummosus TaxID=262324 RepID=UPI003643795C
MSDAYTTGYPQTPHERPAVARMSGRSLATFVGLTLLAGVFVYAGRGGVQDDIAVAPPQIGQSPQARPQPLARQGDVGRDDAIRVPAPRRNAHLPAQSPLRQQFEQAPDLYAYAQTLRSRADAGEPEAIWLLTRVYDYCANYSNAPVDYGNDTRTIDAMKMRSSAAMAAARTRVSQRCARFAPEDNLSYSMIVIKRTEAAKAGSLPAEASLLAAGKPLENTEEYLQNLVDRVVRSKDADAYSALAPGMGIAANGRTAGFGYNRVAGTQFAELAWQLAACKLGQDCGPKGSLMTSYCANGGICSQDPQQDFASFVYDAAIPRQGADVVQEMVDSLTGEERTK